MSGAHLLSVGDLGRDGIEEILPKAKQMPGWKGIVSLADRASGKVKLITLWESSQAMEASEEQGEKLRQENVAAGAGTIAGVRRYEVLFAMAPSAVEALRR